MLDAMHNRASEVELDEFLGREFAIEVGLWRSLVDRDARLRATIESVVACARAMWTDARAVLLWDKDVCVFSMHGVVIADIGDGRERATGRVTIIPRSVITRVSRFDRADTSGYVSEADAARRAQLIGFYSGAIGSQLGFSPGQQMVAAVILNRFTNVLAKEAAKWQFVEIVTGGRTITLEMYNEPHAAHEIVQTLQA
jgi:hypothetical protein